MIQPGVARANDPALQSQMSGYWDTARGYADQGVKQGGGFLSGAMRAGGKFAKSRFDVDVGDMGADQVDKWTTGRYDARC